MVTVSQQPPFQRLRAGKGFFFDDPVQKGYDSYATDITTSNHIPKTSILSDLSNIFRYKNTWILTIVPASLIGPVLTFAGLWGLPYLTTHYDLTPVKSASLLTFCVPDLLPRESVAEA